jgi:hypothetical protein
MRARTAGIVAFGVAAVAIGIAALTFPYQPEDEISATYIVAVAVACAGLPWGVGLVIPKRWRWLGIGFATIVTLYAAALGFVFVRELP